LFIDSAETTTATPTGNCDLEFEYRKYYLTTGYTIEAEDDAVTNVDFAYEIVDFDYFKEDEPVPYGAALSGMTFALSGMAAVLAVMSF